MVAVFVSAADGVEVVVERGETEGKTRGAHRCDGCPAVGVGVVALCGGEAVLAFVSAADGVEVVVERGETEIFTHGAHRCDGCPAVKVVVVALCSVEAVVATAADGVEVVVESWDVNFKNDRSLVIFRSTAVQALDSLQ
eukprot:COSAG05_NODE_2144_length_3483_cov_4.181147_5_plen_139_part_00